ncbi:MAG: hypothetical protein ACRBBU_15930 [Pseudooceanicola sp.]
MTRRQIAMSITFAATLTAVVFGSVANATNDTGVQPVIQVGQAG